MAEESRNRWQHDRQQRVVVERLLERRHEERRVERSRREAHELDDLASQAWLRRRVAEAADEPDPEAGTHPTDDEEVHQ